MPIALEVRNIFLSHNDKLIFQDLSFSLKKGEAYLILGASGSGKSLLLKICAGLVIPDEGQVMIGGIDLATASKEALQTLRAKMGFVFQDSALISNMAIYDNVALPLRYHKGGKESEIRKKVEAQMALFGVDRNYERSIPAQLSLETRQRAALARALVLEPEILLLDQPTDSLGTEGDRNIDRILQDYQHRVGASLLEAAGEWPSPPPQADRVGLLESGRIVAEGTVEEMQAHLAQRAKLTSSS